ncbi:MAG: hypothetical protein MUC88_04550 [Planctomycetes bacterium]|nr:hypothetical protein [Planctomycetota bacterium]
MPVKLAIFVSAPDHFSTRSSCGFGTGSERSRMALTSEKMAVVAPKPRASEITATTVYPGFFSSVRTA